MAASPRLKNWFWPPEVIKMGLSTTRQDSHRSTNDLALLQRLKKKYRESLEDLLVRQTRIQSELEEFENLEEHIAEASAKSLTSLSRHYGPWGRSFPNPARPWQKQLEERIATELAQLKMEKSRFHIEITDDLSSRTGHWTKRHRSDRVRVLCESRRKSATIVASGVRRGTFSADVGDENGVGECGSSAGVDFR